MYCHDIGWCIGKCPSYRGSTVLVHSLIQDWEKKYIHPNWSQVLQENFTLEEVIPRREVHTYVVMDGVPHTAVSRCLLVSPHL